MGGSCCNSTNGPCAMLYCPFLLSRNSPCSAVCVGDHPVTQPSLLLIEAVWFSSSVKANHCTPVCWQQGWQEHTKQTRCFSAKNKENAQDSILYYDNSHFYTNICMLLLHNNSQNCPGLCHLSGSCTDSSCLGISWISFLLPPLACVDYQLPLEVRSWAFTQPPPPPLLPPAPLSDSPAHQEPWARDGTVEAQ